MKTKQWYKIKEGVEYSTDFKFFITNQIGVVKSNGVLQYISRLESKWFLTEWDYDRAFGLPIVINEIDRCKEIHKEILEGKHGVGELVN